MLTVAELRLERLTDSWELTGPDVNRFTLMNEYLSYLADRNYSRQTVRVYGFSLLAFCRWLNTEDMNVDAVTTHVLLRYLAACRQPRRRISTPSIPSGKPR